MKSPLLADLCSMELENLKKASELKEHATKILTNLHYHNTEERGIILLEKVRQCMTYNQQVKIKCDGRPDILEGYIVKLQFGHGKPDQRNWWIILSESLDGQNERVITFNNILSIAELTIRTTQV